MNKVVCSGYFNPIHIGHIECFREASKLGPLTVIVNSDKQVALKGSIPFFDEDERCAIVLANKYVSKVKLSIDEDESVAKTLALLKADVFYNSGDRDIHNVNEKERLICEEIGTSIVYGNLGKVQSSSELIEKAAREWVKKQ